jgi:hypothetical protein
VCVLSPGEVASELPAFHVGAGREWQPRIRLPEVATIRHRLSASGWDGNELRRPGRSLGGPDRAECFAVLGNCGVMANGAPPKVVEKVGLLDRPRESSSLALSLDDPAHVLHVRLCLVVVRQETQRLDLGRRQLSRSCSDVMSLSSRTSCNHATR